MSAPAIAIGEALADPQLLGRHFEGPSWDAWKAILKAAFAEPLSRKERRIFHKLSGGRKPPKKRARELWVIAGRRSGKSSIAAGIVCYLASFVDYRPYLREGERCLIPVVATSREQSAVALGFIKGMMTSTPLLRSLITSDGYDMLSLSTGADIAVMTNSFRSSRGRSMGGVIMEECSFWRSESTSIPDLEVYRAIRPSLATIPNSMVIGIGSAYRRAGLMYQKFKDNWARDSSTLIIRAETRELNVGIDQELIDEELKADPAAASSEWLSEWRQDIETYIDRETVEALVVPGRVELAPEPNTTYTAFTDPAGGSGQDAFTLCIGHFDDTSKRAVLDVLRERRPRFRPSEVIAEYSALLRRYRCLEVVGDAYGGDLVPDQFLSHGISYRKSEQNKSAIYSAFIGPLNNGSVELLDNDKLISQIAGLERRVARGSGKENIDHPNFPGAHDDSANACAGCLTAIGENSGLEIWARLGAPDQPPAPAAAVPAAPSSDEYRRREARRNTRPISAIVEPGEAMVRVVAHADVHLVVSYDGKPPLLIPEGESAVPERLADHWYLRQCGVRVLKGAEVSA